MTRYFLASNGITPLQLVELPPMPWISSRTSPAPSSRYATRSPCNIMTLRFAVASLLALLALVTLVGKSLLEWRFGGELAAARH